MNQLSCVVEVGRIDHCLTRTGFLSCRQRKLNSVQSSCDVARTAFDCFNVIVNYNFINFYTLVFIYK